MGDAAEGLAGGQGCPYIVRERATAPLRRLNGAACLARAQAFSSLPLPMRGSLLMNEASAAADAIINVGRPTDDALSLWSFLPHCCWNARLIAVDPRRIDSGACGALATTAASGQAHGLRSITLAS